MRTRIDTVSVPWWFDAVQRIIVITVCVGMIFMIIRIGEALYAGHIDRVRQQQQRHPECQRYADVNRAAACVMAAEQEAR